MNAERSDFDRALRTWFEDGPTVLSDRVVDTIADRIARQPQRRSWRLPWRLHPMSNTLKLAAGLAAAIVVAVVAWQLLPGRDDGIGSPATPTPAAPTAAPTPTARLAPTPRAITYEQFGSSQSLAINLDLPVGWDEFDPGWLVGPNGVMVVILETQGLYSDPCHWDIAGTGSDTQPGDLAVGVDALELATALHTHNAYTSAGAPMPTSLGSHAGYAVEIQLPADLDFVGPTCDVVTGDEDGEYVVFGAFHFYPQGPSNRWQVTVVDVGDVQVGVILSFFAGTPADDLAAARALIESIEITP